MMACQKELLNPVDPELTEAQCIELGLQDECGNCMEFDFVDLGWGDCNTLWNGSALPYVSGCMDSGCFSIQEAREIYLYYHKIDGEGLPPEIGYLTNLTWLHLGDNNLVGQIPIEIGDLKNLGSLHLSNNNLTVIPSSIGNLTNLKNLQLARNHFTEIPEEICNIYSNIVDFSIANNSICGELPSCLQGVDIGFQNCP